MGFHRSNDNPWKASDFTLKERRLLQELTKRHKVILASFLSSLMHFQKLENLTSFSAIVVGYQNNQAAQAQLAKVLLGEQVAKGKLPVSIHPDFPAGHGMTELQSTNELEHATPLMLGWIALPLLN